ncbi:MAG: MBOAT family protein [Clostridia bacterium]|nr:MBOAT family protein [Clostridia bacterium]
MEFASVFFIELFLPAFIALYYLIGLVRNKKVRNNIRNVFLLILSLVFYAWGGIWQLGLFVCTIAFNYAFGRFIERARINKGRRSSKAVFVIGVAVNVLVLAVFKYYTMIASIVRRTADGDNFFRVLFTFSGAADGVYKLLMPLAISFITFQSIAYLADVYLQKTKASRNVLTFSLFMSLLCQMTQGPIMRYGDLAPQIEERQHSLDMFRRGLRRFCYGLGKKVLIANTVGAAADKIWAFENIADMGSGIAWLGIILYTLQIYYDFSGYTDMAIGIGGMLGFKISENFDYPYTSLSIQEFWRRWHISLSSWFRDYIYIPLGGNRVGKGRLFFNLFIVFLVTGIWHGANLTFILWGLMFALFSIIERAFLGDVLRKNPVKPLNWIYATFVVMMGWVLFRAPSLSSAFAYYGQLFSFKASLQGYTVLSYLNFEVMVAMIAGIILCGPVQRALGKLYKKIEAKPLFLCADGIVQLAILVWSMIMLVSGSYNPSIYGNF